MADGLLDPVACIGTEPRSEPRVVIFSRADQSQVPFSDQVVQNHPPAQVLAGDLHHQAEVGLNHARPGISVTARDRVGQNAFFGGGQEPALVDVPEIGL